MSNGFTVAVTMGRNIGDKPMDAARWAEFQCSVRNLLARYGTVIQEPARKQQGQVGVWDGVIEHAACFVALLPNIACVGFVRGGLKTLALAYQQQSIGYLVCEGSDNLVYP